MLEHYTISGILLVTFLGLCILQGIGIGVIYLFRITGNKKANNAFGWLLIVFAIALIRILINRLGIIEADVSLYFLPLWNILFFGPLFFFGVKFSLYPGYQFRWSDMKHLFVPFLQLFFYWYIFLFYTKVQQVDLFKNTINPTLKIAEGVVFIMMLFGYVGLAYRYIKYKQATLKKLNGYAWERMKTRKLNRMVKGFFVLAVLNTFYVVADFVAYYFYGIINMFGWLGDFSFALILYWLGYNGYKLIFPFIKRLREGSRQIEEWEVQELVKAVSEKLSKEKWYLNPELRAHHLAKQLNTTAVFLEQAIQNEEQRSFFDKVNGYRAKQVQADMHNPRLQAHETLSLAYNAGFTTKKEFKKYFEQLTQQSPEQYRKGI